jgi:hypothetical protein
MDLRATWELRSGNGGHQHSDFIAQRIAMPKIKFVKEKKEIEVPVGPISARKQAEPGLT